MEMWKLEHEGRKVLSIEDESPIKKKPVLYVSGYKPIQVGCLLDDMAVQRFGNAIQDLVDDLTRNDLTFTEFQRRREEQIPNDGIYKVENMLHALHGMSAAIGSINAEYARRMENCDGEGDEMVTLDSEMLIRRSIGSLLANISEFCSAHYWEMNNIANEYFEEEDNE